MCMCVWSSGMKDCGMRFAYIPLGGSLVTLTEFWRTDTGKHLSGMEERKRRKSLWMIASGAENPLTTASMANIHDAAR